MSDTQSIPRHGNLGVIACQLVEVLKSGTPGDSLTDEQLSATIGKDTRPQGDGYSHLQSAIRYCETNFGVQWKRTKGAGAIKCLDAPEVVSHSTAKLASVRRTAKRTVRNLSAIDHSKLNNDEKSKALALSAQFGTLALFSKNDTTAKLATRSVNSVPDVQRLIEAFK